MLSIEYWILLILLFLCLYYYKEKKLIYITVLYMTLLAVLRDTTVGTDFLGYRDDFYIIKSVKSGKLLFHRFEIGFLWIVSFFKKFSNNYNLFISILFIPCIIGVLKFIKDHKVNWAFALFIYFTFGFYFTTYNIIRQMMVISICIMFLPLLYKKRYLLYAISVIITSILFHKSELLFLLLIPIHYFVDKYTVPIKKNYLYVAIIFSALLFYMGHDDIKNALGDIVELIFSDGRYVGYILRDEENVGNKQSLLFTLLALVTIYVKSSNRHQFLTYVYALSVVIFNIFNIFGANSNRVALPFQIFQVVLFPLIVFDRRTRYRPYFVCFLFLICLILFFNAFYLNNAGQINPYVIRKF